MDNPFFTPPPIIPSHPPTPVKTTLPEDPFKNPPFINNNAIKNPLPEINTVPKILEEDPFFSPPRIVSAPAVEDPFFHLPKAISLEVPIEIDPLFHPPKIIAPDTHNLIPPKHLSYGAVQTKNDDGELEEGEISGPTHKKPNQNQRRKKKKRKNAKVHSVPPEKNKRPLPSGFRADSRNDHGDRDRDREGEGDPPIHSNHNKRQRRDPTHSRHLHPYHSHHPPHNPPASSHHTPLRTDHADDTDLPILPSSRPSYPPQPPSKHRYPSNSSRPPHLNHNRPSHLSHSNPKAKEADHTEPSKEEQESLGLFSHMENMLDVNAVADEADEADEAVTKPSPAGPTSVDESKKSDLNNKRRKQKARTTKDPPPSPPKRTCIHWMRGQCYVEKCNFDHSQAPPKKQEICKFYMSGFCTKEGCLYSHDLKIIPCKYYNTKGYCSSGDACKFGHFKQEEIVVQESATPTSPPNNLPPPQPAFETSHLFSVDTVHTHNIPSSTLTKAPSPPNSPDLPSHSPLVPFYKLPSQPKPPSLAPPTMTPPITPTAIQNNPASNRPTHAPITTLTSKMAPQTSQPPTRTRFSISDVAQQLEHGQLQTASLFPRSSTSLTSPAPSTSRTFPTSASPSSTLPQPLASRLANPPTLSLDSALREPYKPVANLYNNSIPSSSLSSHPHSPPLFSSFASSSSPSLSLASPPSSDSSFVPSSSPSVPYSTFLSSKQTSTPQFSTPFSSSTSSSPSFLTSSSSTPFPANLPGNHPSAASMLSDVLEKK